MDGAERDRSYNALHARLEEFARTASPAVILAPEALAEAGAALRDAGELMRTGAQEAESRAAALAGEVGSLHWQRYQVLPADHQEQDLTLAALLFSLLLQVIPEIVPPELRRSLAEYENAVHGGLGLWLAGGNSLAQLAETTGNAEALEAAIFLFSAALVVSPQDAPDRPLCLALLGDALRIRSHVSGDPASLDEAIEVSRTAASITGDHPNRVDIWGILGGALLTKFEKSGDTEALDKAIEALRSAIRYGTADEMNHSIWLSRLGDALRQRFVRTGNAVQLDEAVDVCHEALRTTPAEHPYRSLMVARLGGALLTRSQFMQRPEDLGELVNVLRDELAAMSADDPYRYDALILLAQALRVLGTGGPSTGLDDGIELIREAVLSATPAHRMYGPLLGDLSNLLAARFRRTEDDHDLDEAISIGRVGVAATPPGHPARATNLVYLGLALADHARRDHLRPQGGEERGIDRTEVMRTLWEAVAALPAGNMVRLLAVTELDEQSMSSGDPAELDQVIAILRQELRALASELPMRPTLLARLSQVIKARFERSGVMSFLEAATEVSREAAASASPGHREREMILSGLAGLLVIAFQHTGDVDRLNEAILTLEDVLAALPSTHPSRADTLNTLSVALRHRFEHTGDTADLEQSIHKAREAAAAEPGDSGSLSNLGVALHATFEHSGDDSALDEAVRVLRAAVAKVSASDPMGAIVRSNLGDALVSAYWIRGDHALLNEAIRSLRQAVADTPALYPSRVDFLSNLGTALTSRYERVGDTADLVEAVDAYRAALSMGSDGHHRRGLHMANLGTVLWTAFRRARPAQMMPAEPADGEPGLAEVIRLLRAGTATMPSRHLRRATHLSNLGNALLTQHERSPDPALVEEAVVTLREATTRSPGAYRAIHLNNLGFALRERYRLFQETRDLDEAGSLLRQASALPAATEPQRAWVLHTLGVTLQTAFDDTQNPTLAAEAMAAFKEAADTRSAPALVRVDAGAKLGALAATREQWSDALDAYSSAVALLPRLAARELGRGDQETGLRQTTTMASDAAACALHSGNRARAVEVLEHGRNTLLARALESRADHTDLLEQHPDLGRRLEELLAVLDHNPATATESVLLTAEPSHPAPDARHEAAQELDELLAHIRTLPRFERFLALPRFDDLRPATDADGPVVVLNVSQLRCDALIVSRQGVRLRDLPGLTAETIARRAIDYLRVLHGVEQATMAFQLARQRYEGGDDSLDAIAEYTAAKQALQAARRDREQTLGAVTEWLWDEIADPVLTALGFVATPGPGQPWPRMWWCPTGPLTLLPLHAAGYHAATDETPRRTVIDRAVSSYTPTLQVLLRARAAATRDAADERMLVIALPDTPGQLPLTEATRERDLLPALFSGRLTLLEGTAATWAEVREQLPRHCWAHFICHGDQNLADPSRGGLLLYDRMLTVADISDGHYQGEFAFLSACKSATGGVALLDETITLAAALHYTGYRHVIATLWSVYDLAAADVAEAVYTDLISSGQFVPRRAAYALHDAVRRLRDVTKLPLSGWTPFTHIGP